VNEKIDGIPTELLDKFDEEYLRWTLKEVPSSPMIAAGDLAVIPRKHLDIPYGKNEKQKIDLYLPPQENPDELLPLIVFFHGGGFFAGDKRDMQVCVYLGALNHGYAVASVNYRLSNEAQFPEPIKDCKAAVRHLKAIAPKYGIDPSRFAAVGNSAGAYMALMIAASPNISLLEDFSTGDSAFGTDVRCCIATYPCTDFSLASDQKAQEGSLERPTEDPTSPESRFMGTTVSKLPSEIITAAKPATYLTRQTPPIMIKAGTADHVVPHAQSVVFANLAKAIMGNEKVDFELVEGADHHDPAFKQARFLEEALSFIDRHMKQEG
jgi:acetyl esterase/lipase